MVTRRGFLGRLGAVALVLPALPSMTLADAQRKARRELLPVEQRGKCYLALVNREGNEITGGGYERSEVKLRSEPGGLQPYVDFPVATAGWGVVTGFVMWRDGHVMGEGNLASPVYVATANSVRLHNFIGLD